MMLRGCVESDDVTDLDPVRLERLRVRERLVTRRESLRFDAAGGTDDLDLPAMSVRNPDESRHHEKIAGPDGTSARAVGRCVRRLARKVLGNT